MKELVVYFSPTGTTKKKALELAKMKNVDIYEIEPEVPYTKADLNWMDSKARSTILEKYDFSNKEIVLFATSGGSGWGETLESIKPSVDKSCKISLGKVNSLDGI